MTEILSKSRVLRAGQTARTWSTGTDRVRLDSHPEGREPHVAFQFALKSKGGGVTEVKLEVGTDDFLAVLAAMVCTNREKALREMAVTLANELGRQPEYDEATARSARDSVLEAADEALAKVPPDLENIERHVRNRVRQWVRQLNDGDASKSTD